MHSDFYDPNIPTWTKDKWWVATPAVNWRNEVITTPQSLGKLEVGLITNFSAGNGKIIELFVIFYNFLVNVNYLRLI